MVVPGRGSSERVVYLLRNLVLSLCLIFEFSAHLLVLHQPHFTFYTISRHIIIAFGKENWERRGKPCMLGPLRTPW